MKLADLFNLEPAPIYGQFVRRESPMGPWPTKRKLSPAAIEQRRKARQSQVGQSKAANRVKR